LFLPNPKTSPFLFKTNEKNSPPETLMISFKIPETATGVCLSVVEKSPSCPN
jgi:hypothetical protein